MNNATNRRDSRRLARIWTCALVLALLCVISSSSVGAYAAGYASRDPEVLFLDAASGTELTSTMDLFRNAYVNDEGQTVVASDDGSKVVAPGTSGSYEFAVRNSGGTAATYKVWAEASQDGADVRIPIQISLTNGSRTCENLADVGKLSSGSSAVYRIAWEWPFEGRGADGSVLRSADARDTALGNAAAARRASYSVTIHLAAEADYPVRDGGAAPSTGDTALPAWPFALLAAIALAAAVILRGRKRGDSKNSQSTSENAR